MNIRCILITVMALHVGFVVLLWLAVLGLLSTEFFLMLVQYNNVELVSYTLMSCLMLISSLNAPIEWSRTKKISALLCLGSLVPLIVVMSPFFDVYMVLVTLLMMITLSEMQSINNLRAAQNQKRPTYLIIAIQGMCVLGILSVVLNFSWYYFNETVFFTTNVNLYFLLFVLIFLVYTFERVMLSKVEVKWLFLFPSLSLPLVFIDLKRTLVQDGFFLASLIMLFISVAIIYQFAINRSSKKMLSTDAVVE